MKKVCVYSCLRFLLTQQGILLASASKNMSKKENYTFPNLEALLADSSATKVDLMNGKIDASPFRQVGVEICRTLVVSHDAQTVGKSSWETYFKLLR